MGLELSAVQASGSWDKTIHIWKPSTRSLLVQLKGHVTWVKSLAFSPDALQLASAGYSRMVKVWDCNTGKCIETLKVRPRAVAPKGTVEGLPGEAGAGGSGTCIPEPKDVLLAGRLGCGPLLCLHCRWETLSVWSCGSGKTPSPLHSQITQTLSKITLLRMALRPHAPASPCPGRMGPAGMNL
ncbi:hypothetical protein HPG69_002709 [Diceros bicornis minor]|uniref:Uncharacterized protein n=1 Tax=Diceros bicornis minor TaxID=77932 RepID=A0A7J7FLK8_DICBM|nr:hypothetical protein HPG69_002709 [Diceros bicornis minor]